MTFVWFLPGIYHRPAFRNEKETYRRIVLWISADYLNQLKRTHSQIDYCFQLALNKKQYHFRNDSGTAQILFGKLFDLLEEYHSSGAFHEQLLTCYTGAFLLQLNRIVSEYSSPSAYREAQGSFFTNLWLHPFPSGRRSVFGCSCREFLCKQILYCTQLQRKYGSFYPPVYSEATALCQQIKYSCRHSLKWSLCKLRFHQLYHLFPCIQKGVRCLSPWFQGFLSEPVRHDRERIAGFPFGMQFL